MDASQVQTLFRQAVANDDAAAFRQGLEGLLGTDGPGLSPEREYEVRRPDVVIDLPQSGERFRGRDSIRTMQEMWPGPGPVITVRKVTGAGHVWVVEAGTSYAGDPGQAVVLFELDGDGLITGETRYYTKSFEAPAWRAGLVEAIS
jgi:hypothetical protein